MNSRPVAVETSRQAAEGKATANSSKTVNTTSPQSKVKKGKRIGRRRRGKKDVILDFTKRAKKPATTKESNYGTLVASNSRRTTTTTDEPDDSLSVDRSHNKKAKGKLDLATSSRDYGGNLGLPEKVTQREYETTGQFFRRLNRLVAKAKVEASLESRFDMTLTKSQEQEQSSPVPDSDHDMPKVEHKLNKSRRVKR